MITPRGLSVTLTLADTAYQLIDLLAAVDTNSSVKANKSAVAIVVQNPLTAGGTRVYVGNSDVTGTNQGTELAAGIGVPLGFPNGMNPLDLNFIWLMANAASARVNVWVFQL